MDHIAKFLFESIATGKIDKEDGIMLLKLLKSRESKDKEDIAVIGIATRLPMADNPAEYWNNIRKGVHCIREYPESRKADSKSFLPYFTNLNEDNVKFYKGGFLDEVDKFDYNFFKLSPREASLMDPHQRLFMEVTREVFEDAGYTKKMLRGSKTGIYLGYDNVPIYGQLISKVEPSAAPVAMAGNVPSITASRIAYMMDLKGPSMLVDTACSSSLVAVHLAFQAIRNGECEQAVAGGIRIDFMPVEGLYTVGIEASGDATRTFDDDSDGTVWGEGAAVVMLKPLSKALKDGDNIYTVIKGSAINQDGSSAGITAPNVLSQEEVLVSAWKDAGINPETISYIEAHGTGTKLGDPIEIDGLQRAFRRFTDKKQFCAIGSVKTNIGHLDCVAGISGLIKAVLALKNRKIPPMLHFKKPNRKIDFVQSPVYVNTELRDWEEDKGPRRCGVNGFGFSGTNCHVVLEQAPGGQRLQRPENSLPRIFVMSAGNKVLLNELIQRYRKYISEEEELDIDNICYTASTGREHFSFRLAMTVMNEEDFKTKITKISCQDIAEVKDSSIQFGWYVIVPPDKEERQNGGITEREIREYSELSGKIIDALGGAGGKDPDMLSEICALYVKGADIPWDRLYNTGQVRRVSLPTYPFERIRCWVKVPEVRKKPLPQGDGNLYYGFSWKVEELPVQESSRLSRSILVFKDKAGSCRGVVDALKAGCRDVIEVGLGNEFKEISGTSFTITGSQEDYERLLGFIKEREITQVVHLFSLDEEEIEAAGDLAKSQERGVYSLFRLVKAMLEAGIKHPVDMVLVSRNIHDVTGDEPGIKPENATLFALGKVIGMEYPHLVCRCIDIGDCTDDAMLLSELKSAHREAQVAFRGGRRYVEEIHAVDIPGLGSKPMDIKEDGAYIITGGTGGIGLETAKYLSTKNKVNLVFINRSPMPPRDRWDEILHKGEGPKMCGKIRLIREIECTGSSVVFYSADVSKEEEMKPVIDEVRQKYGRINGIVHSAGVAGDGFIIRKDESAFDKVLSPKVKGTWILDRLTQKDNMDFFVMFSSATSILGAPGQGDYTAANAYMDSFGAFRKRRGKRTLTINWTSWKDTGMALDYGVNTDTIFKALPTTQAINAFDTVLNKDIDRVLVGEINYGNEKLYKVPLPEILSEDIRREIEQRSSLPGVSHDNGAGKNPEVKLKGRGEGENYTTVEKKVAKIWREVLGFEELDINDNFFQIGGDSLMITRVHALVEEQFPGEVAIADLFSFATIQKLSRYIQDGHEGKKNLNIGLLTLPEDYFDPGTGDNTMGNAFKFEAGGRLFEKLKTLSANESIGIGKILLSLYAYLFSEITGKEHTTVQVMMDGSNDIASLDVDLGGIDSIYEMFRLIGRNMEAVDKACLYSVKDIQKLALSKGRFGIVPIFYKSGLLTENIELTGIYDIALAVSEEDDRVVFKCEYNGKRLRKEKIKEMMSRYLGLVDSI